jgi:hypothetical protein
MLYPAVGGAVGFLAAVFTHALVAQSAQSLEREAKQAHADKMLLPYSAVITRLDSALVTARTVERVKSIRSSLPVGYRVTMKPVLAVASDERTLVLDQAIEVVDPSAPPGSPPRFAGMVRIVAPPQPDTHPQAHWLASDGAAMEEEVVALLAHSVDLALAMPTSVSAPQRTYRYRQGGLEMMERAQLIGRSCNRLVLRTLRDWILSVPMTETSEGPPCTDPRYAWRAP